LFLFPERPDDRGWVKGGWAKTERVPWQKGEMSNVRHPSAQDVMDLAI